MLRSHRNNSNHRPDRRVEAFRLFVVFFAAVIVIKLFVIQILEHDFYQALASGQHEILRELIPERGTVSVHDYKDETIVPVAANQQLAFVYADPRQITDPDDTAEAIGQLFGYTEDAVDALEERLDRPEDPYEPIKREVDDDTLARLLARKLSGIHFVRESVRLYPETAMGGHVIGFVGSDEDGNQAGRYGIEGYFDELLAGKPGTLRSERDIAGRLIAVGDRRIEPAVDGADIVLTMDRTIQFKACTALMNAVAKHGADGGSIIVVEPSTGRIFAMCGVPDFDPNRFSDVETFTHFNNPAIFDAYEPGSIFKPITMAAAMDVGAVTPATRFEDLG
ncbi:hypothetical protein FJZ23_03170, partial [Candidatus Parcubacteria bacterium]|nr:hypothetical protein [Candidatus Parcubacteria bacterium]